MTSSAPRNRFRGLNEPTRAFLTSPRAAPQTASELSLDGFKSMCSERCVHLGCPVLLRSNESGTLWLMISTERPPQLTLVFDGTCGFCTRSVRLLNALDRHRRVRAVPFQKGDVRASVGLTVEECEETAWAIAPDGGRYRGAEAVNAAVAAAVGSALPLLLYSLPGVRKLQDFVYHLVASNRSLLPGDRPYCAQQPAKCR